jgi:hypothetical protein
MPTYTNLGIQQITTGTEAGTWGTITNTNFDYFDNSIVGVVNVTLTVTGTTSSPNTLNVQDYTASDGRNRAVTFVDAGTALGATCYVQITKNGSSTAPYFNGYYFIRNSLTTQDLIIFQGAWGGSSVTIPNGTDAIIKCGGGAVSVLYTKPVFTGVTTTTAVATTSISVGATTAPTGTSIYASKNLTGSTSAFGVQSIGVAQSDVTSSAIGYYAKIGTASGTPSSTTPVQFYASQGTLSGTAPTNQYGFLCSGTQLTGATNNYAFYAANQDVAPLTSGKTAYSFYSSMTRGVTASTNTFAFYGAGTAPSYFGGDVTVIGNFLVGTTSTALTSGNTTLDGTAVLQNGVIRSSASSLAALELNRTTTFGGVATFFGKGVQVGGITVSAAATSFDTSSDYRLKENVQPMLDALGTVAKLRPVVYDWRINGERSQGFIAHELAEVVPESVTGVKDAVDEDGKIIPQGVDYSKLVVFLAAAIQEQQAMIEDLKTRLAALEAK